MATRRAVSPVSVSTMIALAPMSHLVGLGAGVKVGVGVRVGVRVEVRVGVRVKVRVRVMVEVGVDVGVRARGSARVRVKGSDAEVARCLDRRGGGGLDRAEVHLG